MAREGGLVPGRSETLLKIAWLGCSSIILLLFGGKPAAAQASTPQVLVTRVDSAITPVIADYLSDGLAQAERRGHRAFIVELDTPGGLDTSMREIVQEFIGARVPVIVYVSPQGARAASAGAIITFSAHIAAMAPGTAIGASTPVDLEGADVERKIVNDAAAFAESIATLRGRNVEFAGETVRTGRSAPAVKAAEIGAVDFIARSLPGLLDTINGREVKLGPEDRPLIVQTRRATAETYEMGLFRRMQQLLADPNLAFLFLSLGSMALIYELVSPGLGAGGILGAIFIVLALVGLSVLPVSAAGLLFLAVAVALFAAELFAPGVGIAAAGGAVALALSGVFLFRQTPGLRVSLAVMLPVTIVVGAGVVLAGRLVVRSRKVHSTITGEGQYVGRVLKTARADGNRGQALVDGAWWNIRSDTRDLREGDQVRVTGYEGLELLVEPIGPSE